MKIGILSDTHGYLAKPIFDFFSSCSEIWHAGDIGSYDVVEQIKNFKPLRAVHGNIDNGEIRKEFPEDLFFSCEGISVYMTHIGGRPPYYNKRVKRVIAHHRPNLFVCGHNHILCIKRDALHQLLYLNPGAAGNYGNQLVSTIVRLDIIEGRISNMELMEIKNDK